MPLDYRDLMPKLALYSKDFIKEALLAEATQNAGIKIQDGDSFINTIKDPVNSAKIFFGNYAFARAWGQRAGYDEVCIHLLKNGLNWKDGESFYQEFVRECQNRDIGGSTHSNNQGVVIQGYDAHIENQHGRLFILGKHIKDTHHVSETFCKLIEIKGIKSKIAALICRDLVWSLGCEANIPVCERPLLQPVDRWIWRVCKEFWEEYQGIKKMDLLAAMRLSAAAEELGISGIQFNQGTWFFCKRYVRKGGSNLRQKLEELQNGLI